MHTHDTHEKCCTRCGEPAEWVTRNNAKLKRYTCPAHLEPVEEAIAALGEGCVTLKLGEDVPR